MHTHGDAPRKGVARWCSNDCLLLALHPLVAGPLATSPSPQHTTPHSYLSWSTGGCTLSSRPTLPGTHTASASVSAGAGAGAATGQTPALVELPCWSCPRPGAVQPAAGGTPLAERGRAMAHEGGAGHVPDLLDMTRRV